MHWFLDPIKFKYADFSGRATREEFWMFALFYTIIYIVLVGVDVLLGTGYQTIGLFSILFAIATLVPAVAIGTRRLHDTNLSGWWQAMAFIPMIGWIIAIVLLARAGNKDANQYGAAPQGVASGPIAPSSNTAPSAPVADSETELER